MSATVHSDNQELARQFLDQGYELRGMPAYRNHPVEGVFDDAVVSVTQEDMDSPKIVARVTLGPSALGGFASMIGAEDLTDVFPNGASLTLSDRIDGAGARLSISGDDGPRVSTAYVNGYGMALAGRLEMDIDTNAPDGLDQKVADKLNDPKTHVLASSFVIALAKKASDAK